MTRRRRILLSEAVLAACFCIALGVLAMLSPRPARPGVTKANFDRIKVGMAKTEVERIFGRPAMISERHPQDGALCIELWVVISEMEAGITFENEAVVQTQWDGPQEPPLDMLRRWLHLPE